MDQRKCETIFGKNEVIEMRHIEIDSPSKYLASFMTQIKIYTFFFVSYKFFAKLRIQTDGATYVILRIIIRQSMVSKR